MNWKETERYLSIISQRGMKPGLGRMQTLMKLMGHPEKKFKAVHVTGTNGKGSVCAMIESIVRAAGVKTGLYISPHLLDLRERASVLGKKISYEDISRWIQIIRQRAKDIEPQLTYFELITAVAFCYFAENEVELAIVEVGLGGQLDATNILPAPEVSIITNVTLEHTDYLGKTVSKIAAEKSGIIKNGLPCVTGAEGTALKIIRKECRKRKGKLVIVKDKSEDKNSGKKFGWAFEFLFSKCALKGNYQRKNLKIVLETIKILQEKGWPITYHYLIKGLEEVEWPGRFEWKDITMEEGEIPVLLDGAHNPAAMKELILSIQKTKYSDKDCLLIFNVLKDKDISKIVSLMMQNLSVKRVLVPLLNTKRTSLPEKVKTIFKKYNKGVEVTTFNSVPEMWREIFKFKKIEKNQWMLVTGSFYLIGDTMKQIASLNSSLEKSDTSDFSSRFSAANDWFVPSINENKNIHPILV